MRAELRFAMSERAGSTVLYGHTLFTKLKHGLLGLVLEGVLVDAVRVEVEHGVVEVHVLDLVVLLGWITEGDMPAVVVHGSPRSRRGREEYPTQHKWKTSLMTNAALPWVRAEDPTAERPPE